MKKIIMIILLFITIAILFNSNIVINTVIYSIDIFKKSIFPSLLPFFILSDLLINYGFVEYSSKLFKPFFNKVFKLNENTSFILVMSMISGFPSSAKYTKELYLKGIINEFEASKILLFTHFSNPLFITGAISITFLNNKKAGLLILLVHYISNFIVGFLLRNLIKTNDNKNKIKKMTSNESFSNILSTSIKNGFNTLFLILGTMIFFLILTNLLNKYLHFSPLINTIISGFFEITGGISNVSFSNIHLKLKCILITMMLSFGGLSVHMQVKSILADTPIKYHPYFIARLLHSAISGLIMFLIFDLICSPYSS